MPSEKFLRTDKPCFFQSSPIDPVASKSTSTLFREMYDSPRLSLTLITRRSLNRDFLAGQHYIIRQSYQATLEPQVIGTSMSILSTDRLRRASSRLQYTCWGDRKTNQRNSRTSFTLETTFATNPLHCRNTCEVPKRAKVWRTLFLHVQHTDNKTPVNAYRIHSYSADSALLAGSPLGSESSPAPLLTPFAVFGSASTSSGRPLPTAC